MSQEQVREWWSRNPMSYDVDDPIPYASDSRQYFREVDRRIFHPRYMRLTADASGRPFSLFVDFDRLAGKDVLDVGCGSGIATQLLAEAGAHVTAVDLTEWAVETTRRRLTSFGLGGRVLQADAEQLPFEDDYFDLVFAWGVIHHTSDTDKALSELVRVCRRGGEVVLMVYHRRSLFFVVYRGFQRFLPVARRFRLHFEGARAGETEGLIARHFTVGELRRKLQAAGLVDIWVQPYGQDAELLPLPRRLRLPITERLPRAFKDPVLRRLGHQLGARATKPPASPSTGAPRLLVLTPAELSRDMRARRQIVAARAAGYYVVGACGRVSGEAPVPLDGVPIARTGRSGRVHATWAGSVTSRSGVVRRELRGLARLVRLLWRTAQLVHAGRGQGPVDVVHANDLDTLPAAFLIARRWHAHLVYDAHELYSEFEAPAPPLTRRLKLALERGLAQRAQSVITVSDGMARELQPRLRLQSVPLVVMNAPTRTDLPLRRFEDGPLRAVYQGRLGPGRALADLLAGAPENGVELALRIPLADPEALRTAVAAHGLADRVHVLDPVAPGNVIEALRDFEVGVIFDRPLSRNGELTLPNKLFEYLTAGLAVIVPNLETIGPLVEEERVGLVFDPGHPDQLAVRLAELAADRPRLLELRERARELASSRLNAEVEAKTLRRAWTL
jgi:SAM-dependent methyltransferase/glycosyltransferase involved in cell wall biosynthesis